MPGPRKNESAVTREYRERAEQAEQVLEHLGAEVKRICDERGLCDEAREIAEQAGVPWPLTTYTFLLTTSWQVKAKTSLNLRTIDADALHDLIGPSTVEFDEEQLSDVEVRFRGSSVDNVEETDEE